MARWIVLSLLFSLPFLLVPHRAYALKKRIQVPPSTSSGASYSSVKLSRPTNSTIVSFKNLNQVTKITYELSYVGSGNQQGAMGSFVPTGSTDTRNLYFGTCSKGVCTPHYNIKNATLIVRTRLKSGTTHVKRYRIKV